MTQPIVGVGARTLLGAPGITTSSIPTTSNKKLLRLLALLYARNKDATRNLMPEARMREIKQLRERSKMELYLGFPPVLGRTGHFLCVFLLVIYFCANGPARLDV